MDSPSLLASSVDGDVGPELTTRKRGYSNDSDSDDSSDNSDFKRTKLAISNNIFKFSLNSDVLLEIFEHGCSTPASIAPNAEPTVAPALVFSQVCRSWRSLALAQSRLWSSFSWGGESSWDGEFSWNNPDPGEQDDDDDDEPIVADERFVHLWDLYLSRSGKALLDVSLALFEYDVPEIREYLINSVFARQDRLKCLKLFCEQGALPEGKAYLLDSAPRLECLDIEISEYDPALNPVLVSTRKAIAVDLSNRGSLRELSLSGNVFIIGQVDVLESLQVVRLNQNNVAAACPTAVASRRSFARSTSGLYSFLSIVPNIYWVESVFGLSDTILPSQRLLLCRLRKMHLTLESGYVKGLNTLFQNLELPVLSTLTFVLRGGGMEGFRWWTKNSTLETLTELHLSCDWSRNPLESDLQGLLLCTPGLQYLSIESDCISSQTLALLTLKNNINATNLCPKLEKISLAQVLLLEDVYALHSVSSQSIVDLLSSRCCPPQERQIQPSSVHDSDPSELCFALLALRVTDAVDGKIDPHATKTISSFVKQGLTLYLTVHPF